VEGGSEVFATCNMEHTVRGIPYRVLHQRTVRAPCPITSLIMRGPPRHCSPQTLAQAASGSIRCSAPQSSGGRPHGCRYSRRGIAARSFGAEPRTTPNRAVPATAV